MAKQPFLRNTRLISGQPALSKPILRALQVEWNDELSMTVKIRQHRIVMARQLRGIHLKECRPGHDAQFALGDRVPVILASTKRKWGR